ncbi:PREDICTED: ubiquitin carboxyl-terminal hydrolase 47-like, partial [Amphimedon queenslandica]|uniref:Uncharacterized protein n=1 Tax=Amphimedon queenslandica TaxID=400682 RepID=A0AAN0J218_AMPQE
MSYGRMFYNVGKAIKQKRCSLKDIKELLFYCNPVLSEKVKNCRDIPSLLRLIQNECSLTNIALLHSVVDEMKITEADEHIKEYKTELKEFCKSLSISLCLKERFASIPPLQCETVTFVLDWEPEELFLKDIEDLLAKASGKLLRIERQDVRQKELKDEDQDLVRTEVISYIILEEAEYKLRDAISSKEKETIGLKQELSLMKVLEEESLSIQSDTESIKEEEPLYEKLTALSSQFNEIEEENKELSDKLSKMKVEYSWSLSSNTDSAASKVRRGMSFEIDDCKFCLEAMTRPDYQPLLDNKRIIEKLQERITLMNIELITAKKHNEKIIKDIQDLKDEETDDEEIEFDSLSDDEMENQISTYFLYCNHPVTGELTQSTLEVDKNELLPIVLDKAYKLMELSPHIPIERCRLVKYYYLYHAMEQSFDLDEFQHQPIGQIMGVAGYYGLFLETRKENETFKKYNAGSINLEISVVDLSTGEIGPAKAMRGQESWTVKELKQRIKELLNLNSSIMRLLALDKNTDSGIKHLEKDSNYLKHVFFKGDAFSLFGLHKYQLLYVSSDLEDYQKEFKHSLMYRYVDFHVNCILLNITIPPLRPGLDATPISELTGARETERLRREGDIVMNIISANEEKIGEERKIQVEVSNTIKLSQLKVKLVPLVGVPSADFKVCRINDNEENEIKRLDETLKDIESGSELIVRLGRVLQKGEGKVQLYLLQVNDTEFCKFMMESIATKHTSVREFKKQIIEEAKVQGIDYVLELDKMRLRKKNGMSPGLIYMNLFDHELHYSFYMHFRRQSMYMYVELLQEPEKKNKRQTQVYVIRWHPSQCSVDPIEEIILDNDYSARHAIIKLSKLSGVAAKYISCAEGKSFPIEISCLDIENKLTWYSINSDKYLYELHLYGDGYVIYYKDNRETMKELTD